jgi:hypothetical protein
MNKMQWLDSLNAQQMQIANMIVDKAEKEGVDPKLALSIAFQESRLSHGSFQKDKDGNSVFKPITGTSGEIGLMQVMPSTAKLYGYEPDELQGLDRNLEIGLKILKAHMDQYGDPRKAAAAYNSGRATNLPESTKKYVEAIEGFGGFSPTSAAPSAAPAASAVSAIPIDQEAGTSTTFQPIPLGGGNEEPPGAKELSWKERLEEQIPSLAGAGVGATVGTSLAAGNRLRQGAGLIGDFMRSQIVANQTPAAGRPANTGATSGTNWIRNWGGINREIAGGVPDASAAYNRMKGQGEVSKRITKMYGINALQPGGLSIQGQSAFPAAQVAEQRAPSLLDDAISKLGQIARGGLRVVSSAPVAGALGGYGAVSSAEEAYNRAKQGDKTGAMIAGSGGLGILATIPHPYAKGFGLAASVASPLTLMALDRARQVRAQPPMPEATPEEMQQAQRPAFMTARP